ncbi:MAG: MFS transporter [Acidobacteriota bacterium]
MSETPAPPRAAARPAWERIVAWCTYDFANSVYSAVIPAAVFGAYYTQTVVGNGDGRGDFWWGIGLAVSAGMVAISSPIMGAIADMSGARRLLLTAYTLLSVLTVTLFTTIEVGDVAWGCLLFIVANFAMEGAIVFYNAYLPDLVPANRIGRVSAWGFGFGYVGSMVGLATALPLVLVGRHDDVWLLVAIFFGGFGLPALHFLGTGGRREMSVPSAARHGWREVVKLLKELAGHVQLKRFLIAYFVYVNGVNAAIYYSGPIARQTFGLELADVVKLFFLVQGSALIGALLLAKPTDSWGPKRVVMLALTLWATTGTIFVFAESLTLFWTACVIAGLGLGSVQSASRAFMASFVPSGREDEFFGLYALCGKTAAPLGTLVFAVVSSSGAGQRAAIACLVFFFFAGLVLVARVQGGGPTQEAT